MALKTYNNNYTHTFTYAVGNLAFNSKENDTIWETNPNKRYYVQVNCKVEIILPHKKVSAVFPGVALFLSDELDLYSDIWEINNWKSESNSINTLQNSPIFVNNKWNEVSEAQIKEILENNEELNDWIITE